MPFEQVEHDPFEGTGPAFVPVEHDPFDRLVLPPVSPAAPPAPLARAGKVAANALAGFAEGVASLPGRYLRAAGDLQRYGDVYDPRPALETALMMVGTPGVPVNALGSSVGKGIRAYHGSPHDFERFDMSKIGTGEGAQAYGHGLYFAEEEGTARTYRDALSNPGDVLFVKSKYQDARIGLSPSDFTYGSDAWRAANEVASSRGNIDAAIKAMRESAGGGGAALKQLEKWKDQSAQFHIEGANPGRMYEVNINAEPHQFLDWDKPLAQHAPEIRDAVLSLPQVARQNAHQVDFLGPDKGVSGGGAYRSLVKNYGTDLTPKNNVAAADALRDAGIPGIKYLDQGSRSAGEGSSNYVLFRDDIINILRKYGIAGMTMLPPSLAATVKDNLVPVDHDPFATSQ